VIVQRHKATHHYDVLANKWQKVNSADTDSDQVPYGHDAYAPIYFDPGSGHGQLLELKTSTLWAYDPGKHSWTRLAPEGHKVPDGNKRLAYFDPAHDVFVVIQDTAVWAYRYR
jgi:hypothetical protein